MESTSIDWEYLHSLRELQPPDEPDVVAELLQIFSTESVARVALLHDALRHGDAEEIRRLAHMLRGSAGQIGALELARVAERLEQSGRQPESDVSGLVDAVDDALREALAVLDAGGSQP
jgi:two-component system, sensor histidine kinase and response regulator